MGFGAKYIGIDLGGTKIAGILADAGGNIFCQDKIPTKKEEGKERVLARIYSLIRQLMKEAEPGEVKGIGLCSPGPLNVKTGVIIETPNLKWENTPVVALMEREFTLPVILENDGNAAAFGEYRYGAARGTSDMIYMTVSTGIGGGIIANGKLVYGRDYSAGEVGHVVILPGGPVCSCGRRGCIEALASGTSIVREVKNRLAKGEKSLLQEFGGENLNRLTAKEVEAAAVQGDCLALSVLEKAFYYLGIAVGNLVNILNPEVVVIGGGVSKMGPLLFEPVQKAIGLSAFPHMCRDLPVVPAQLGGEAGTKGMVALLHRKVQKG